ncbi:histone-like nucleoid-structuring protein Lsr2 [Nakamurella leprariae]|uniref:Lsr2 family protein n=1 Tax=Nakamurella leprariae TaxID=2803911 RepID=A0A939C0P7_9ACTN|nr:Lsr2 family protein [Nakamurella leprariae]MBM9466362.1 Lsr2 family protein [Nakamurella leprariae]
MAQQTSVTLVDDLDGGRAVETVSFSLDGAQYEIDLSKKNAAALRKTLSQFVDHGRKVRSGRPAVARNRSRRATAGSTGPSPADVRKWAMDAGISVSPRGRISADVIRQYEEAVG